MLMVFRFIGTHWSQGENEDLLCLVLPRMVSRGAFPSSGEKDSCRLPQGWQDQIVSKFERLEISPFPERGPYDKDPSVWRERCLPKYSALLNMLEIASVHPSTNARIADLLLRKLKLALRPSTTLASDEVHFIVSQGFRSYLRMCKAARTVDITLSPLLWAAVPRLARSVGFLEALLAYEESLPDQNRRDASSSDESSPGQDLVMKSLAQNLSSPSHELRLVSLQLLDKLNKSTPQSSEFGEIMLQIQTTPLRLENIRTISMLLRRLGQMYGSLEGKIWLHRAVPSFVFGLLTVQISPVWDHAVECLQQISQTKVGEDAVCSQAFSWLNVPSTRWNSASSGSPAADESFATDFECTAFEGLKRSVADVLRVINGPDQQMRQNFDEKQKTAELVPESARSRALKVLNAISSQAEKRSRHLVPHFLSWASEENGEALEVAEVPPQSSGATWSLVDRKALLGVFAQFANPKVLYQHDRVYGALLQLLENGDVDVQKLALKAVLAWKQDAVKAYQENLEYLLDEARFKNELTVFLQGDNVIKAEHRPELMPVLLRLLYGRTISKKGAASGRQGLHATRLAVLRNLSVEDMGSFLEIVMGKLRHVHVLDMTAKQSASFDNPIVSARTQVGLLNMLSSLILELGSNVSLYVETLVNPILYCLIYASRQLSGSPFDSDDTVDEDIERTSITSLVKKARSIGFKCLNGLFQNAPTFQWDPYADLIVTEVMAPRLRNLAKETTQGVSGTLQVLSTWSALPKAALYLAPHGEALPESAVPQIVGCIAMGKTKDPVKIFALGIIHNLVKLASASSSESEYNEVIKAELLDPHFDGILAAITSVAEATDITNDLLEACVETIVALTPLVEEPQNIRAIIQVSIYLLQQPPRRVSPKLKGRILLILENLVSLPAAAMDETLLHGVFTTLSSLFSYFKDRENRQALSRALSIIAKDSSDETEVVRLCSDLNSFKEAKLDEPDYDRRLQSFNAISQPREVAFSPTQWLPLLHNLVFFIRDDEEFGILSSNSADGICRFIRDTASCTVEDKKKVFERCMETVVMPAIYAGAREQSETVRRETLRILGCLLTSMPCWGPVADLEGFLVGGNEETAEPAFFFNLLSPATSKQMEALQELEQANSVRQMGSRNISQFFIPILEHFVFRRADGGDDHGLGAQAAKTIGNLAMSLNWRQYRTTLQQHISYIGSRPESQKQTMRLLTRFTDALTSVQSTLDGSTEMPDDEASPLSSKTLLLDYPDQEQLTTSVLNYFLPPLLKHLHEKDESEVSYRVPVGVIVVKLLKILPTNHMDQKLAGVLTDICHILRSKAWESREMARNTLVQIVTILGPSHFGFVLKELRGALTRGYQLHVLSYTMHSMLVAAVPCFKAGDLDYCLPAIVTVVMDDIFGVIGQEKDADGYTNQMKEVKSSKSQDSMELIARNASISRLVDLVRPMQALLMQKLDLKMVRKIDALMARVTAGLLHNSNSESRDTLVFCYEVIQEVYNSRKPEVAKKLDPRIRKYLVQRGAKASSERVTATRHTYKMTRFALDILRSMFKKHDSLRDSSNIAGFLPILGDAILDGEDEVKIAAFRLLTIIVKVPFANGEGTDLFKVAVKEATKSIALATSTTTELSQTAIKLLAVVLRDRRDVVIKDAAIDTLLGKLQDDLTEPQYRHVTFNFLRSVLERRVETAAVYDTMDYVGTVMITNDDKDTRDLARGAFFQFIREYPQKKARWSKQLNFIVANLKYKREGGRLSVMEIVHLLLTKSSHDFCQEIAATCFLPLFLVLANDESEKCRLAASALIKEIFRNSDKERTRNFLALLRPWLAKEENKSVQRLALLILGHYFEVSEDASKNRTDFSLVYDMVMTKLGLDDVNDVDEEVAETAFGVVRVLTARFPEKTLAASSQGMWDNVTRCLGHHRHAVKLGATRLIAIYLSEFANLGTGKAKGETMRGPHGLVLDQARAEQLVRLVLGAFRKDVCGEALAAEAAQVLIFLGPRLRSDPSSAEAADSEHESTDEVDDEERQKPQGLRFLLWRLSHVLREEIRPTAEAIVAKTAAMEVLETVCRRCSADDVRPSLRTILMPLQHLTDPTIPTPYSSDEVFKTKHEGLKTRCQIFMDALQKKFGTSEYSQQLLAIREEVRARRQQRSAKRRIEAVSQPEKFGRDKRKKFEKNKTRMKMRSKEQKEMRQAFKNW